mgnify:CR=1 FL=1
MLRRIPCGCDACLENLAKEWKLTTTDGCDSEEVDLANTVILENITTIMAENIEVGSVGAFQTEDNNADGYYLV